MIPIHIRDDSDRVKRRRRTRAAELLGIQFKIINPHNEFTWATKCHALDKLGRHDEAETAFTKAKAGIYGLTPIQCVTIEAVEKDLSQGQNYRSEPIRA